MKARLRLARRLRVESLEVRTLMHADPLHPEDVEGDPGLPQGFVPADIGTPTAGDGASARDSPAHQRTDP